MLKEKTPRDEAYLKWVRTLPCVATGLPADDAHHIIGCGEGGMGMKASDYYTFPLTREAHAELHRDPKRWEMIYGTQWKWVAMTQQAFICSLKPLCREKRVE